MIDIEEIKQQFDNVQVQFDLIAAQFDSIDQKFILLDEKVDALVHLFERGFDSIDEHIEDINDEIMRLKYNAN